MDSVKFHDGQINTVCLCQAWWEQRKTWIWELGAGFYLPHLLLKIRFLFCCLLAAWIWSTWDQRALGQPLCPFAFPFLQKWAPPPSLAALAPALGPEAYSVRVWVRKPSVPAALGWNSGREKSGGDLRGSLSRAASSPPQENRRGTHSPLAAIYLRARLGWDGDRSTLSPRRGIWGENCSYNNACSVCCPFNGEVLGSRSFGFQAEGATIPL